MSFEFTLQQQQDLKNHIQELRPTIFGNLIYYFLPFRRKMVLKNMRHVFSSVLTPEEIVKLAKCFYSHIAKCIKEIFTLRFLSIEKLKQRVKVISADKVTSALDRNQGVIVLTGHFGSWEYAPLTAVLQFPQLQGRFHMIRKTIRIRFLENFLFKQSYQAGINVIPNRNAILAIEKALRQKDVVVFVMDQHASVQAKKGIEVEFFGHRVGTYRSLAVVARASQAPVIPMMTYRQKDGTHILYCYDPIPWIKHDNSQQEIYLNTRRYNQILEQWIINYPEQWLWMHNRWK
jgi:Kdo2-lipid IVA lauroyltransferase/acyltransferase